MEKESKQIKIKYKKLPNSKGRNFCDELWALMVKIRDDNKCIICGSTEYINAHHLISRRVFCRNLRWDIVNGVSVCPSHHDFSLEISFHTFCWAAEEWMKNNRSEQYNKWVENRNNISINEKPVNYEELYENMEEQYKKMTGNYFRIERISQYLLNKNVCDIKNKLDSKKTIQEICLLLYFPISQQKLKNFIDSNQKYFNAG